MAADRSKVLQQAQLLASRGQYDAAIVEWKKLAMDAPNDGSIHNSIGDLHLKRNASAEATTAFLQAAAAFRTEGATLKAIAAFKKVLKIDPTRYEVYRHLGDLNAERGLLSSAVQDYLTLGKHYIKERKSKEALEIYQKIVSQDPSNLDAQQRVAELCVQENLQDEATKVYLQLGRERSAQGRYDEAKDAYLAVLRIDPKNSEAAQFVDSVQKGGTGSSKAVGTASGTATRKLSEPLDLLAEATRRIDEKQFAGAEAILNQMLTREPGNPQVCQLLARVHLHRGDVQVALGEYRFLAGAALRAQDYLLAESLIGEFLSAKPDSVPILELYGEFYEEKGEAAAAQQYAQAIEILLEHPEVGMESLHEELYEKVKSLSPDAGLVSRLAAKMRGESAIEVDSLPAVATAPVSVTEQSPVESVSTNSVSGFVVTGAEPDEVWATASPIPLEQDRRFSLEGAAPDGSGLIEKEPPLHVAEFSLENATPDGDGIQALRSHEPEVIPLPIHESPDLHEPVAVELSADPVPEVVRSQSDDHAVPSEEPLAVAAAPDAEPVIVQDYEAHFTLGVAYKNMGLHQEAKEEFEVSRGSDTFYLDSCLMTALCFKEEQQLVHAIRGLEIVLSDSRCQGAKGQAIRYELGLLYEAEAQWEKAAKTYQSIPSFHDVPHRLESLRNRYQSGSAELRLAS